MKTLERIFYALWLGLTVYLFQVAEYRPLGWYIIGPVAVTAVFFIAQTVYERRRRTRQDDLGTSRQRDSNM